ncbi:hypothetical protein G7026_15610 [Pseudomonas azotifigens]|uniref:Uncharacterized protein n=1 Tax=Stutzerimonas azotifigens TaxID=291995 RepID=A0ABR5Z3L9_9GAMM|nr:hypothetical protein [Stutzerimonas azotifigens]
MIAGGRLGDYRALRYPQRHPRDKTLYGAVQQLRQAHLKSAPAIDKVLYDNCLAPSGQSAYGRLPGRDLRMFAE